MPEKRGGIIIVAYSRIGIIFKFCALTGWDVMGNFFNRNVSALPFESQVNIILSGITLNGKVV